MDRKKGVLTKRLLYFHGLTMTEVAIDLEIHRCTLHNFLNGWFKSQKLEDYFEKQEWKKLIRPV